MLTVGGGPLGAVHEVPVDYYSDNLYLGNLGCSREREEFIRCLRENEAPYCGLAIGRQCLSVSLAAERSIQEKRRVVTSEFENPSVRNIIERYTPFWELDTPTPLPAPSMLDTTETPGRKMSRLAYVLLLLRLALRRRSGKGIFKEFSNSIFQRLAYVLNGDSHYRSLSQGLNVSAVFHYPERTPVVINIKDGNVFVSEVAEINAIEVNFTENGWRGFMEGENLNRLSQQREITVRGDYNALVPYASALLIMGETAKRI
jgi:hypothetical protein